MSNDKIILAKRPKPELPVELTKFTIFYNRLKTPMGPEYVGNYEFDTTRLSSKLVEEIKQMRSELSVTEMIEWLVIEYNVAVRSETVANYYDHSPEETFWVVTETEEKKKYEAAMGVQSFGNNRSTLARPKWYYRAFVTWAIQSGYEYYQVAAALEVTPPTIRSWANQYGYKRWERIPGRVPDMTGKHSRRESLHGESYDPNKAFENASVQTQNGSHYCMVVPEDVADSVRHKASKRHRPQPVPDTATLMGQHVMALLELGFEVTLSRRVQEITLTKK